MRFTVRPSSRSPDTPGSEWTVERLGASGSSPTPLKGLPEGRTFCPLFWDRERCTRGWNFLRLLTGFFAPSTTLMPYATKFFQDSSPSQGARGVVGGSCREQENSAG